MADAPHSLAPLFHPRTVAVVGASSDPHKIGGRTFRYIQENWHDGTLYAINDRYPEVQGVPTLRSVQELPEGVDLGFVIVPAPAVEATVAACAERRMKTLVIFSSGFAEIGEEGRLAQERVKAIAAESGMRVVGPNCMGVMNLRTGLWGTFTGSFDFESPLPGRVAMVSQSGAFGIYCYMVARGRGLGLSLWVTTGNEVDVDVADCLEFVANDPGTDIIVCYMEGARDKAKLVRALETARANRKPIVMLKVGRTDVGAVAASSHTASLVGADGVYDALFRQYGVHRADTFEELVDVAYAGSHGRYPTGRRLGLVTVSGGVGVLMADAAVGAGLEVPEMPPAVQKRLKELIPFAGVRNPVDTTAQMINNIDLIRENLALMLDQGGVDSIVLFLSSVGLNPRMMKSVTGPLLELRERYPDSLMVLSGQFGQEATRVLEGHGFLLSEDPSHSVRMVAALAGFRESFDRAGAPARLPALPAGAQRVSAQPLSEVEAKRVLASAGIPVVPERLATSADEAVAAAEALGLPCVLKIVSPDILHKSEMGGVLLGLDSAEAVRAGYDTLLERSREHAPKAHVEGVLVAPMVRGGVETILGVQRDPVFGPVVLFGLGGILVEVLKDVTLRIAPFDEQEALAMLREVKGYPILEGVRGQPRADIPALARALAQLSVFADANADVLETLDINPFIVLPEGQGALAVDALIVPRRAE
ncbi:MAG TPA: acetate--CoA ligase family protein [bacterium]|nr:acetate--CoA ligase family protein [bacterium]